MRHVLIVDAVKHLPKIMCFKLMQHTPILCKLEHFPLISLQLQIDDIS